MRIFNLIGEGFHALRSLITPKESAMTDTSIIQSATPGSDAALPQFAVPDSNVPTDPQLQRLSSPSTAAPATSEETPGETHVAQDATAQHHPAPPASDASAEPQPDGSTAAEATAATQSDGSAAAEATAATQPDGGAAAEATAEPQPDGGAAAEAAAATQPAVAAEVSPAADTQPEAQTSVADAAAGQARAQTESAAVQPPTPKVESESATPDASATQPSAQSVADSAQSDFSAGVKDFNAAFDFVQQGIEHLGSAARSELFALARKYL